MEKKKGLSTFIFLIMSFFKNSLFFSLYLLTVVSTRAQSFAPVDSIIRSELRKKNIAGGVCLVMHKGNILLDTAYGCADLKNQQPMTTGSIFRIASQTKAIVSVAFLQLTEKKHISLDAPIEQYIPDFAEQQVVQMTKDSFALTARQRSITIRDLLSHQSGISSPDEYPKLTSLFARYGLNKPLTTGFKNLAEEVTQIARMPLAHQPGERFSYGLSTDVIGRLIEIVSGQTLDVYLRENIFRPLHMNDTYFYLPADKQTRLVKVYTKVKDSLLEMETALYPVDYPLKNDRQFYSAIGGLVSTTHDYVAFLQCLLNKGRYQNNRHQLKRLLSEKALDDLLTNQLGTGTFIFGGIKSLNNFGLGVGLTTPAGTAINHASVGSFFWGGAFNTAYMVDRKRELITLFYFQRSPFVLPPLLSLLEKTAISIIDQQQ